MSLDFATCMTVESDQLVRKLLKADTKLFGAILFRKVFLPLRLFVVLSSIALLNGSTRLPKVVYSV